MNKNKRKLKLNKEEGSGLVLALMVLLVLSVLGASLGVVTIGSLQLSTVNRDSNSAYYIAEAGMNVAYEEFEKIVKDASKQKNEDSFFQNIKGKKDGISTNVSKLKFEPQFGDEPDVIVEISSQGNEAGSKRNYTIKSTGTVDKKKRTVYKGVEVTWIPPEKTNVFPSIPKSVLLVNDKLQFKGGTIKGNISIDSKEDKRIQIGNGTNLDGEIYADFESVTGKEAIFSFPDNYYKKDLILKNTKQATEVIDWNSINRYVENHRNENKKLEKYYKNILKEQSRENINLDRSKDIDLSTYTYYKRDELKINGKYQILVGDTDKVIFTEKLTTGGNTDVKVSGDGSLIIMVSESVLMNSDFKLEGENIHIVSTEDIEIKIAGNAKVKAKIFAPNSDVIITNSGKIIGCIVAEDIVVNGNGEIKGHVLAEEIDVENSGKIEGNIITEDIEIEDNGKIYGNIIAEEVEIENSGSVLGSVIAKTVELKGNPTLTYKEFPFNGLDSGGDNSEGEESKKGGDYKITPGPTLEIDK